MQLNRNAKGTIAFSIAIVLGQLWMAVSPVYDEPWEPWPPILPIMGLVVPFMAQYFRPILIASTGFAIVWVWEGKRAGYLAALVLSAIATGFGVLVFLLNALNQEWLGTLTGICAAAIPSIMAIWYSYQGYRDTKSTL